MEQGTLSEFPLLLRLRLSNRAPPFPLDQLLTPTPLFLHLLRTLCLLLLLLLLLLTACVQRGEVKGEAVTGLLPPEVYPARLVHGRWLVPLSAAVSGPLTHAAGC